MRAKSYSLNKIFAIVLFLFFNMAMGQDNYVIFNTSGDPKLMIKATTEPAKRGDILKENQRLILKDGDTVRIVNKAGELREINNAGKFNLANIGSINPKTLNNKFARKYFIHAYKELLKNNPQNGIDFKNDELVLMRFPSDSIKIYLDEINFEWQASEDLSEDYYFILKDVATQDMTTYECNETYKSFKIDENSDLRQGNDYEWAVSDTRFFKLNEMRFYKFRIMDKLEFKKHSRDLKKLIKELERSGLNKDEIRKSLCEYSKFCY